MTQNEDVLSLLRWRGHDGITAMDALHTVGTFRLAARIADLRADGHVITSEMVTLHDGRRVARYRLEEPAALVQQELSL